VFTTIPVGDPQIAGAVRQMIIDWAYSNLPDGWHAYEDYTETYDDHCRACREPDSERVVLYRGRRNYMVRPRVEGGNVILDWFYEAIYGVHRDGNSTPIELSHPQLDRVVGRAIRDRISQPSALCR